MNRTTIVLAWVLEDFEVVRERRADLGERPITRRVLVPKAAVWLKRGSAADVLRAQTYADKETGYKIRVFTYPTNERDPLGRAKREVLGKPAEGA